MIVISTLSKAKGRNLLFLARTNLACTVAHSRRRCWLTPLASVIKSPTGRPLSASAAKLRLLKKLRCTLRYEKSAWASGAAMVAGVDEVGRGSLFGPVGAAGGILDRGYRLRGLRASKLLLPGGRGLLGPRMPDQPGRGV